MYRHTTTILTDEVLSPKDAAERYKIEADVIMTATILGFTASRFAVGHPVEFAVDPTPAPNEDPEDRLAELREACDRINGALHHYRFGGEARAVFAPDWHKGALITGAVGSSARPFAARHAVESEATASILRELASVTGATSIGYQGRGAYTGFVDDPVGKTPSIQSTMRFTVPDRHPELYGERWLPRHFAYRTEPDAPARDNSNTPWGLIGGRTEIDGMVDQPAGAGDVVGYTHGMIQAIYTCVQRGPWCTPFEIAAGSETTKMASCFPCTLLMYAAGFPPSAIHLGRGESWVPFYELPPGVETATGKHSPRIDAAINTVNTRWRIECGQHLDLGIRILSQGEMANVAKSHRPAVTLLAGYLARRANDVFVASGLILDAVTVHESETARVTRTLLGEDVD
ncbi:hypothetical protein GCM10009682_10260 [Luedemannella flava]|uniref:Uncharacterized protein n=1 Tax=Luedemannella flava TaxID=349316 RepID=A0ABP4XTZ5_9ACTN